MDEKMTANVSLSGKEKHPLSSCDSGNFSGNTTLATTVESLSAPQSVSVSSLYVTSCSDCTLIGSGFSIGDDYSPINPVCSSNGSNRSSSSSNSRNSENSENVCVDVTSCDQDDSWLKSSLEKLPTDITECCSPIHNLANSYAMTEEEEETEIRRAIELSLKTDRVVRPLVLMSSPQKESIPVLTTTTTLTKRKRTSEPECDWETETGTKCTGQKWVCSNCTLINLPETNECEVCLQKRQSDTKFKYICNQTARGGGERITNLATTLRLLDEVEYSEQASKLSNAGSPRNVIFSEIMPVDNIADADFKKDSRSFHPCEKLVASPSEKNDYESTLNISEHYTHARYSLAGVVRHYGANPFSGHYTCDTHLTGSQNEAGSTNKTSWLRCNDSKVTSVTSESVLSEMDTAYILFYQLDQKERSQFLSSNIC